jgi:hypothetical protein
MFLGRFSLIKMLEWRGREHEEEDYFFGNDLGTVMSLRECGLFKFFKIQSMRLQPRLLKYLIHMWDVNEQSFRVGVHTLTLDIEDIYFLIGLSFYGSRVSLAGSRGDADPHLSRVCLTSRSLDIQIPEPKWLLGPR